ncbi:unnamed protein product [Ectocarpus sp. CCAP 1310/34]|nr:unnamed protein product [Ectocarpus sp. CCAP 1310/34]
MGVAMSLEELGALSVVELADLAPPEHRQASIDFGIDGHMLTSLPLDQLQDALARAGVEDKQHLVYLLEEIENIRRPKIDPSKLDRENLRAILERSDSGDHEELSGRSEWSGVSVDSDDRIIALNVTNRHLSGELPAALFEISNLEYLHATSNLFAAKGAKLLAIGLSFESQSLHHPPTFCLRHIPCLLFSCPFLGGIVWISLYTILPIGAIPDTIGDLKRLVSLKLDHNSLTGRIPGSLTRLTSLTVLDFAWNKLTGTIPMKIGTMTSLRKLSLGANKARRWISSPELASLHFLVELRLRENRLAGKISPMLVNMQSLQVLDLTSNALQGHIPESLGEMTNLRELWLGRRENQVVGGIPEPLSKLEDLQSLDLSRNKALWKIHPHILSTLSSSLVYLNLGHNAFEGDLPVSPLSSHSAGGRVRRGSRSGSQSDGQGRNSRRKRSESAAAVVSASPLSYLNLCHNKFTGHVPEEIGSLTSLETLDLSHNKLEGGLPPDIGSCVSLRVLSLSRCGLSGILEGDDGGGLGRLSSLEILRLDGNTFHGIVPAALGNLARLEVLHLQLDRLWALAVRDNNLSGRVPESLGCLTGLRSLRLEENPSLRGPIPDQLASGVNCNVRADQPVLEDTEAAMLGSKLDEWFLMPRKARGKSGNAQTTAKAANRPVTVTLIFLSGRSGEHDLVGVSRIYGNEPRDAAL